MAVDLSALPGKMKDYALAENATILETLLIDGLGFLDYMSLYDNVTDELPLTQMFIDSVLQPGGKDSYTPKGTVGFKARVGKVRPCKVDFHITPTQLQAMYKSYIGKVKKSKRDNVYDLPLEQDILNRIIKKAKSEIRLLALFKGQYNPDTQLAQNTMEGLLRLFAGSTNDGGVPNGNIFNGAPITAVNAIDQVVGVADLVPDEYAQEDLICLVSPTVSKFYDRDYQTTHGSLPYNTEFKKKMLDGTNIEIITEPALSGTHGVFITPRENFAWLADSTAKTDSVIIEKSKRNIDIMMDFECAPEVAIMELVWCNDIALPVL